MLNVQGSMGILKFEGGIFVIFIPILPMGKKLDGEINLNVDTTNCSHSLGWLPQ